MDILIGMISEKAEQPPVIKSLFPFSLLNDGELRRITPFFESVSFPEGATVFSDGYPAEYLYFILSGSVKVSLRKKDKSAILGLLSEGDRFGEEALQDNKVYQTRITCQTKVTALRIKGSKIGAVTDAYPQIQNVFSLFQKTFHLACSENLTWRHETEGIELFSRRHPFFMALRLFLSGGASLLVFSFLLFSALASHDFFVPLLIVSIFVLMIGIGLSAWSAIEWSNDYFILTHERVSIQKKIIGFYDSRHESPVNAILSVGVDTSFWGRLIGYGTVTIRTYTGDLHFARLPHPYIIYELIEVQRQKAQLQARQAEKQEIRAALTGKMNPGSTKNKPNSKRMVGSFNDQIYASNSLSDLLARFFNLRVQNEESVTYRTHWWILLRKTFLPSLFMTAVVLAVLARLLGLFSVIPDSVVYVCGIVLLILGWGWWLYQYSDWQNDVYILTDDQLIDVFKKPLGNEDRRSAPVKNIQTVEFQRKGLINLILNFGTVKIKIGNEELNFDDVYQPSQVQAEIYTRYKAYLDTAKKNDQQRFVEWIKTYDEIKKETELSNHQADADETE